MHRFRHVTNRSIVFLALAACVLVGSLNAQDRPDDTDAVVFSGGQIRGWSEGDARMFEVTGGVSIAHGPHTLRAERAIVWYYPALSQLRRHVVLDIYAEGEVAIAGPERTMTVEDGLFRWGEGRALTVTDANDRIESLDAAPFNDFVFRARRRRRDEAPLPPWAPGASEPVTVSAREIRTFAEGDVRDVFIAQGDVRLVRGDSVVEARRAVVWLDKRKSTTIGATVLDVFVEGDVRMVTGDVEDRRQANYFTWMTTSPKGVAFDDRDGIVPLYEEPQFAPFYRMARRVRIMQSRTAGAARRQAIRYTGAAEPEVKYVYMPGQETETKIVDGRRVTALTGGVHFLYGPIDIRCDNMVVWHETEELFSKPTQVYAEGTDLTLTFPDTTLRELLLGEEEMVQATGEVGYRKIKADRLLIDLRTQEFVVIDATLKTIHKTRRVPVYYHADRIRRQLIMPDDRPEAARVTVWVSPENDSIAYNVPGLDPASRQPLEETVVLEDRLRGWQRVEDIPQDPDRPRSPIVEVRMSELRPTPQRLHMEKAHITTCEFGVPHYRYTCREITMQDLTRRERDLAIEERRTHRVTTVDNWFLFGDVPVFYWPKFQRDLDDDITGLRSVRLRTSSDKGFQVLTTWDLQDFGLFDNNWSQWYLRVDPMSERGVGLGLDSQWARAGHRGRLRSYYIKDRAEFDDDRRNIFEVPREDRGRVRLMDRWRIDDATRVDVEYNYLSDRTFLQEFFENEFKNEKVTENVVYLHHLDGTFGFTTLGRFSVAEFVETVEYMPQIRGYLLGESLWDDRLVYKGDTQLANVRGRPDPLFPRRGIDRGRTWRFDSDHEVAWPLTFDSIQFSPYLGGSASVYEDGADGQTDYGRAAGTVGFRSSTQFWKTYPLESRLWDLRDLRHIVTPILDYENVYGVSHDPSDFYQLDAVDQRTEFQAFTLGTRQRLQTKRRTKYVGAEIERMHTGPLEVVDWMIFDVRNRLFPDPTRDNRSESFGPMEFDYQWRLSERVQFQADGDYDWYDNGELDSANVGVHLNHSPRLRTYIGNRYIRELDSSMFVFNVDYTVGPRWSLEGAVLYDHERAELISSRAAIVRRLHRWVLDVGVEFDPGERDTIFTITLSPQGIPETRVQFF